MSLFPSLFRHTTLILFAASLAPALAIPHNHLVVRDDSSDTDILNAALTVMKDFAKAAFECPIDCSSFALAAARCTTQIVQDLSFTSGLECFCTDVPSGLDTCSLCVAGGDPANVVGNSTGYAAARSAPSLALSANATTTSTSSTSSIPDRTAGTLYTLIPITTFNPTTASATGPTATVTVTAGAHAGGGNSSGAKGQTQGWGMLGLAVAGVAGAVALW